MEFAQLKSPPGKTLAITLPTGDSIRALYTSTKGITYAVAGGFVYEISYDAITNAFTSTQIR